MIEIRLSAYDTYSDFVDAVLYHDREAGKQVLNFSHVNQKWRDDIVVRFGLGKIEIVIEKEVS